MHVRIPVKVAGDSGEGDHSLFRSALLALFYSSSFADVNI
jgi:hypothetical protein